MTISGWEPAGVAFCGDLFLFGCVNGLFVGISLRGRRTPKGASTKAVAVSTQQHTINKLRDLLAWYTHSLYLCPILVR